jgi:hypothetical protein
VEHELLEIKLALSCIRRGTDKSLAFSYLPHKENNFSWMS